MEEILKAAKRSADLTHQLLVFARKQTVSPKVLDLNDTIASMLKMLQRLIGEDIQFSWTPGPGLWPVWIDPVQIDQLLAKEARNNNLNNLVVGTNCVVPFTVKGIWNYIDSGELLVGDDDTCFIVTGIECGPYF